MSKALRNTSRHYRPRTNTTTWFLSIEGELPEIYANATFNLDNNKWRCYTVVDGSFGAFIGEFERHEQALAKAKEWYDTTKDGHRSECVADAPKLSAT